MKETFKLLALMMMLTISANGMSADNELVKNIRESFSLEEGTYVELTNQYGDVEVSDWEKDSVAFEIEIIVRSDRGNLDLQEIMDRIEISFRSNSSYVLADTEWSDDVNFFRKGVQNIKQGIGGGGNIEVNYKVYLPINTELVVNNKFGNVFFGDYHGPLSVNVDYGDLRGRNLSKVKKIGIKYGKLKINEMDKGSLDLSAVKSANIISANDIMISSGSSEIEIDQVNILNLDSKHDDIRIESAREIYGNMSLTDLKVFLIKDGSRIQSKFGSVYFKEIEPDVAKIEISGDRTDIFMNFSPSFDGLFDIIVDEEKKLAMSEGMKIKSREKTDNSSWNITATPGNGVGPAVNIVSTKGFVQIGK